MPDILFKKSIGLDISDSSVEVVELVKRGKRILISNKGKIPLKRGTVSKGEIREADELKKAIKQVFEQAQPKPIIAKRIVFGLSQNQVYTHNFFVKSKNSKLTNKEIDRLVEAEIGKNLPIKKGDLLFSYKVLNRSKRLAEILLAATDKEVVVRWDKFFKKLDIIVDGFDIRSLANYRGLFARPVSPTVCLVDIARSFTDISIFDKEGLSYSSLINIGSRSFTKKITSLLKLSPKEAEDRKRKFGLSDSKNKVYPVLVKALYPIKKEINNALAYAKRKSQGVNEVVLVNNESRLKGLAGYLHTILDISARDGYSAVAQSNKSIEDMLNKTKSLSYLTSIGLALRKLDKDWSRRDPVIMIKNKKRLIDINMFQDNLLKKILIISPLVIAIIVLGVIYFTKPKQSNQAEQSAGIVNVFSQKQSFDLKITIAADSSAYQDDRVGGRIIENTISKATDYSEAVAYSRLEVEKELETGERLWLTPISEEKSEFPMTIKWLAYSENDTERLFLEELAKLNKENVEYNLESIKKDRLRPTINSRLYNLEGTITIALDKLIEVEEGEVIEETTEEPVVKVTIKETETGWLNVRKGPGTNYEKTIKVYPGEEYQLLEESGSWSKIKIDDENEGWVFSSYTLKEE